MKPALSSLLQRHAKTLFEQWISQQTANESLREDLMSNDELRRQSSELLDALLRALKSGNLTDTTTTEYEPVVELLVDISLSRARQGFSPRETAQYVLSLKDAFNELLQQEMADDPQRLASDILAVGRLLDSLSIVTMEAYLKGREEVILRQTDEINDISTPVIRVWEGIVALPIIGTLDSARTQTVMESLLQQIVDTESTIAILDISGVPAVDSLVAQHLIKTVSATRLMGAECIISGIRPEIAQTIVHLGIDLSHIQTKASMASALRLAFQMLHLDVRRAVPRA